MRFRITPVAQTLVSAASTLVSTLGAFSSAFSRSGVWRLFPLRRLTPPSVDTSVDAASTSACATVMATVCVFLVAFGVNAQPAAREEAGFRKIFDGQSLKGWDCDPNFWRVEGGAMVGETKANHQPEQNIFCIWRDGKPADFELKLEYRLTGASDGNSGVQYRSVELPDVAKWVLKGYQADIDAKQRYTGQIYEERARAFLALRGQFAYVGDGKKPVVVSSLGDDAVLKSYIKVQDWNEMHIIARGNVIIQMMNGHVMSQLIDDDKAGRKMEGLLGIQLHQTPGPMKIESRNIRLKEY